MPITQSFVIWYNRLLLIGTAVHELSHAVTVKLCGGTINEIDLTSHVNHHGHYNLAHQIAISYAPLVINTALAVILSAWAIGLPNGVLPHEISMATEGIVPPPVAAVGTQIIAFAVGFSLAAAALPSYVDARNPYTTFRRQLKNLSLVRILIMPIALLILLIFTIPLAFAYLRSRSYFLHIGSEVGFATAVLLQATEIGVLIDIMAFQFGHVLVSGIFAKFEKAFHMIAVIL